MAPIQRLATALAAVGILLAAERGLAQDDGLPAETLAQATPFFAFQRQGNGPALIFTRSGSGAEYDPRLFISSRDGWRLVQLPNEVHNTSWVYAGRALEGGDLWGITEGTAEGRTYLYFASSPRDGRSWRLRGYLPKVSRFAVIDSFAMNKSGKGTLVLRLDEDPSPDAPRLGYYVYMTKSGGREWSDPIFSQGKPLPSPDVLAAPDRSFDPSQATDVAAWQRILAEFQPTE
jgi:hypothetical protein